MDGDVTSEARTNDAYAQVPVDTDRALQQFEERADELIGMAQALSERLQPVTLPAATPVGTWLAWRGRFSNLCDRVVAEVADLDVEACFDEPV